MKYKYCRRLGTNIWNRISGRVNPNIVPAIYVLIDWQDEERKYTEVLDSEIISYAEDIAEVHRKENSSEFWFYEIHDVGGVSKFDSLKILVGIQNAFKEWLE